MIAEHRTCAQVSRTLLNLLTILLPTLEGLCQITVLDGKQGSIFFRYSEEVASEMDAFFDYLKRRHGDEFNLQPEKAPPTFEP
ncbi:hypothetical protein SCOR_18740 [Sulfidibacter corallicola]|uniref:Uncharacterized protein n=1 Tax=Sulfidibacter corallicola TaxID=2818388 RepID=A0A8A4TWL1_SULCO|nr:hypothetical protein [Sulfidibacter corallicola]QTD53514.1 hypothetical protein J3U87_13750 [Sulfidibacter corallicola]